MIARDHGVQRLTEKEFVCVCLCVTIRDQMHKPVTGETECQKLVTEGIHSAGDRVSLHLCVQREDLGTCTSLGSSVPRCQKLESLGSRGSYYTD